MNFSTIKSNSTFDNTTSFQIIAVCFWAVSALIGSCALLVVLLARGKLKPLEFKILLVFLVHTVLYKSFTTVQYILAFFFVLAFDNCAFTIVCTVWSILMALQLFTLFYYSLFQASTVSRSRAFLLVYSLVHNESSFLVFECLVTFVFAIFVAINFGLKFVEYDRCPGVFVILQSWLVVKFFFGSILPSLLTVLVYIFATVYICYVRFVSNSTKMSQTNKNNKFKKNFNLLIKFFILAFTITLSSLLQNVFYYFSYVLLVDSTTVMAVGLLGFGIYALQPLFLVYIHSILKETLVRRVFLVFVKKN